MDVFIHSARQIAGLLGSNHPRPMFADKIHDSCKWGQLVYLSGICSRLRQAEFASIPGLRVMPQNLPFCGKPLLPKPAMFIGIFFRSPHLFPGAARLKRDLERLEEPWTFGLDPAEIPLLLRRYGLRLLKDLGSIEYRADYLGKGRGASYGYKFYRVALAEVNPIRNESRALGILLVRNIMHGAQRSTSAQ
jgi:hypothetical protein